MSYSPTNWVARVGTALNRFLKSNESTESVELTADPAGVSTNGTPFTATNMNKIEQGIYDAHVTADDNAGRLDTVEGTTSDNSDRLDVVEGTGTPQGVGTGNSPTFNNISLNHFYNQYFIVSASDTTRHEWWGSEPVLAPRASYANSYPTVSAPHNHSSIDPKGMVGAGYFFTILASGTIKITCSLWDYNGGNTCVRIMKNGSQVAEVNPSMASGSWTTIVLASSLSIAVGDKIHLEIRNTSDNENNSKLRYVKLCADNEFIILM